MIQFAGWLPWSILTSMMSLSGIDTGDLDRTFSVDFADSSVAFVDFSFAFDGSCFGFVVIQLLLLIEGVMVMFLRPHSQSW
jgi:hypothetical protein